MSTATPAKLSAAERKAQAVNLRKKGLSYRRIADQLGCSKSIIAKDIKRELQDLREQTRSDVEELRQLELERLDAFQLFVSNALSNGDVLPAIDRGLKISERRAKLLGLDAPIQIQVQQQVESAIDELLDDLERNISPDAFAEVLAYFQKVEGAAEAAIAN